MMRISSARRYPELREGKIWVNNKSLGDGRGKERYVSGESVLTIICSATPYYY